MGIYVTGGGGIVRVGGGGIAVSSSGVDPTVPTDKYQFQQALLIQRAHAQSVPITYDPGTGSFTVAVSGLQFNGSGSPIGSYTCGSTTTMICALSKRKWVNTGGDWVGSGGVSQSGTPFSTSSSIAGGSSGTTSISVTAACQWIWTNQKHCAFYLTSSNGNVPINGALGPYATSTLDVNFSDSSSKTYDLWVANSLFSYWTTDAQSDTASSFQNGIPAIVEFYDSANPNTRISSNGKTVTSATLNLKYQTTSGAATISVFVVNPAEPSSLTPTAGIAAGYNLDSGIYSDSSVLAALRITDGMTSADVLDESRCASAQTGTGWIVGGNVTNFRAEAGFDPSLWVTGWTGGDGSNAVSPWGADITKPSAATIATMWPDRSQTASSTKMNGFVSRQFGSMTQDAIRVIASNDATAIARGFTPLAPGLGAIEVYQGGGDALTGQGYQSNVTEFAPSDLDMYFKKARIGRVTDCYFRMYMLLGEGWAAGETFLQPNFQLPTEYNTSGNVGLYPDDLGFPGSVTKTFTAGFSAGATSGTLSAVWPYSTATLNLRFSNGEVMIATLTSGSAAVDWSGYDSLHSSATSSVIIYPTWAWPNRQGKITGGIHHITHGDTWFYDFNDRTRSSGNTQSLAIGGGAYSNTSGPFGYQGRWLFSQGYPVASHPGPVSGGSILGLEFYDFSGGSGTLPPTQSNEMSGWDASWQAFAANSLGIGHLRPRKWYCVEMRWLMNTMQTQSITFSSGPAAGATSATLSSNWTGPTCKLPTTFSNGEQRYVQFNNASTSVTWSGALAFAASTSATTYPLPSVGTDYREGGINIDGKLQWWIDGVFAGETPTFAHRSSYALVDWALQETQTPKIAANSSCFRGISNVAAADLMGAISVQFCNYYGGNSRNDRDAYHYLQGIVAAESYIGPMKGVSRANGGLGY